MTKDEFTHSSSDTQANLELSEIAQLTDNGFPACGTTPTPAVPTPGATRTPNVPLPCSRYRYSMSTTETRTFRSRHSRCCMGTAAVLGSLLTIGVFLGIMIHFTVIDVLWKDGNVHPKLPIPRADTALGKAVPDFLGSVTISNTNWDYDLAVADSLLYRDLAVRVEQELDRVFLLSPLKDIYNFSLVRTFRRGSIVAVFETILTEHRPLSAEKVKSAMIQGLEHRKYIRGPDDVLEIKQVVLDATSIQIIAITTTTVQEDPTTHLLAEMEETTTLPTVTHTSTTKQTTSITTTTIRTTTTVKPTTVPKTEMSSVTIKKFTQPLTSTDSRLSSTVDTDWTSEDYAPVDPEVSTVISPVPSRMWTPWRGTHLTTGPYFWTPGSTPLHGYQTSTDTSNRYFVTQNRKNQKTKDSTGRMLPDMSTFNPRVRFPKNKRMPDKTTLSPRNPTDSWQSHAQDADLTSWFLSTYSPEPNPTQQETTGSNKATFEYFDTDKLIDTIPGLSRIYPNKAKASNPNRPLEPVQPTLYPPDQVDTDHIVTESNIPKQNHGFGTNTRQDLSDKVYPTRGEHDNHIHDWNTAVPVSSSGDDDHQRQYPHQPSNVPKTTSEQPGYHQSDVWHSESTPKFVHSQDTLPNHDNEFHSKLKPHRDTIEQQNTPTTEANVDNQDTKLDRNTPSQQADINGTFMESNGQINETISLHIRPNINESAEPSEISTLETEISSHTPSYQDALFYPGNLSLTETESEKDTGIMGLYPENHPNNKDHQHTGEDKDTTVKPDSQSQSPESHLGHVDSHEDDKSHPHIPDSHKDAKSHLHDVWYPVDDEDVTSYTDNPDAHGDSETHLDTRPQHSNGHGFAVTDNTPARSHTTWHSPRNNLDNGASQWTQGPDHETMGIPLSPHPSDYNFPEDPDELYDYLQRLPNNAAAAVTNDVDAPEPTYDPAMRSSWEEEQEDREQFEDNIHEESLNKSVDLKTSLNSSIESGNGTHVATHSNITPTDVDWHRSVSEKRANPSDSSVGGHDDTIQSQTAVQTTESNVATNNSAHLFTTFSNSDTAKDLKHPSQTLESVQVNPSSIQSSKLIEETSFYSQTTVSVFPSQTLTLTEPSNNISSQESVPSPAEYKAKLKQNHTNIKNTNSNSSMDLSSRKIFTEVETSTIWTDPIRLTDEINRSVTPSTPILMSSSLEEAESNKVSEILVSTEPNLSIPVLSQEPLSVEHKTFRISPTSAVNNMPTDHISGSHSVKTIPSSVHVPVPDVSSVLPETRNTSGESKSIDDNMLRGKDNTIMQNDYYHKESKSKNKKHKLSESKEGVKDKTLVRGKNQDTDDPIVALSSSSIGQDQFTQTTPTLEDSKSQSYNSITNHVSSMEDIESSSTVTFKRLASTQPLEDFSSTQYLHGIPVTSPDLASTTISSKSNHLSTTQFADATIEVQRSETDFIDATPVDVLMQSSVFPTMPLAVAKEKEREHTNPYQASGDNGGKPVVPIDACLDITVMTQFIPGCLTYFSQIMHTDDILEGCQHFLAGVMCVTDEYYKHSGQQCTETQVNAFIKQHARLFTNALPNFDPLQCVI